MEKISIEEVKISQPTHYRDSCLSTTAYDPKTRTLFNIRNDKIESYNISKDTKSIPLQKLIVEPKIEKEEDKQEEIKQVIQTEDYVRKDKTLHQGFFIPETLRFWRIHSSDELSISGLTAICRNKDHEKSSLYYSNLSFKVGIHYWEIICPISCSGIEFGMLNKDTNDYISATFRTTTPRVVGMKIDFDALTLSFWLNSKFKRSQSILNGEYQLLVKMKNYGNKIILNPFVSQKENDKWFASQLILSKSEKNLILQESEETIKIEENKTNESELKIEESKTSLNDDAEEFAKMMNLITITKDRLVNWKTNSINIKIPEVKWAYLKYSDKLLITSK